MDIPSMVITRVQLQLCDYSNGERIIYPIYWLMISFVVSIVVYNMNLFLLPISSEDYISLPVPVNDNLIDNTIDQPSLPAK